MECQALFSQKKIAKEYFKMSSGTFLNSFIPEFLKQTLPSLDLDMSIDTNRGFSLKLEAEQQTV